MIHILTFIEVYFVYLSRNIVYLSINIKMYYAFVIQIYWKFIPTSLCVEEMNE